MSGDDVVVAGTACRFPGVTNVQQFAEFARDLDARVGNLREIEKDKLDTSQFCVHAHQAENCDPQIRILLHCAREALCDAALPTCKRIGCIVSCEVSDFGESVGYDMPALSGYGVLGGCRAMIANRISFECNLTGPSYTVASGNSLVALHNAVNLIRDGICEAVIVGAIELNIKKSYTRVVNMIHPDIERSEGAGMLVLARRDRAHKVYGIIDATMLQYIGLESGNQKRRMRSIWSGISSKKDKIGQVIGDNSWRRDVALMERSVVEEFGLHYHLHTTISKLGDLGPAAGLTSLLLTILQEPTSPTYISSSGTGGSYCVVRYISTPSHLQTPRYLSISAPNTATLHNVLHYFQHSPNKGSLGPEIRRRFKHGPSRGVYDNAHKIMQTGTAQNKPVWLVVGGVGANWAGMGASLTRIPCYRTAFQTVEGLLSGPKREGVHRMFLELLIFQLAHIDLMRKCGVIFDGVIGHSFGEIAALYAAGAITQEQAVRCAECRADAITQSDQGAMIAVNLLQPPDDLRTWVANLFKQVDLACVNSSTSFVLAGSKPAIHQAKQDLESRRGVRCTMLMTHDKAFHSRLMLPVAEKYRKGLQRVFTRSELPPPHFYSTSQQGHFLVNAEYFVNNMINQVQFHDACSEHLPVDALVLELSPHPMFCRSLSRDHPSVTCLPLCRQGDTGKLLVETLSQVHLLAQELDLSWLDFQEEENLGSLLNWDTSQCWYVPKQEHFPVVGTKQCVLKKPESTDQPLEHTSIIGHFAVDVSTVDLNESVSCCAVVLQIRAHLARSTPHAAFVLCGERLRDVAKRSSNSHVDVFVMSDRVSVVYNGSLMFCGQLRGVEQRPENKSTQSVNVIPYQEEGAEHEHITNQISKIIRENNLTGITLYHKIQPVMKGIKVITSMSSEILATWSGTSKLELESLGERQSEKCEEVALVRQTKKLLGINMVRDMNRKLIEFGLDSLMSVELADILTGVTGKVFSNGDILNMTFRDLARL